MRMPSALVFGAIVWTATVATPDPSKPWTWSLDDRLAARFHPERSTEAKSEDAAGTAVRSVDGDKEPALLLPSELYRSLLLMTVLPEDPAFREHYREKFARGVAELRLGHGFFSEIEKLSSEYTDAIRERRRLLKEGSKASLAQVNSSATTLCVIAHRALTAARAEYGRERFDEFLYRFVAPEVHVSGTETRDQLAVQEGGCR